MDYSIDQSTDYSNRKLYNYLTGVDLPSFVKEAGIEDVVAGKLTPKTAFADPLNRLFPINTKARVYVSNAYFVNSIDDLKTKFGGAYLQKVATEIDRAADLFMISETLSEYNKIAYDRLTDEYEEKGIACKIASDEIELFSIKTAADVSRCANHFVNTIQKYPFEWRRNISEQFIKAAEQFDLDELPDLVLKYAGQYYPNIVEVKQELARRMTKLSATNQQRYRDLIEDVDNIYSKDEFFKLAEICHYIEKNAGLYDKSHYRKILGDPVDKIFTLHLSKVAELLDTIEMGGEKFAADDLKAIPADVYHKAFGFETSAKEAEFADIAPTLPRSDVSLFKQLSGIKPI